MRVLVVDDHPLLREGVAAMLMGTSDLAIVGEAGNGREAVGSVVRMYVNPSPFARRGGAGGAVATGSGSAININVPSGGGSEGGPSSGGSGAAGY